MRRPPTVYTRTVVRPWCQLDATAFRGGLLSSSLCQPNAWNNNDIESLARLYDSEIIAALDRLVHQRTVTCRRRPSVATDPLPTHLLGPILFLLYTTDLIRLVKIRGLHPHLFADDTQIYGSCRPEETQTLMDVMSACISDVAEWMQSTVCS